MWLWRDRGGEELVVAGKPGRRVDAGQGGRGSLGLLPAVPRAGRGPEDELVGVALPVVGFGVEERERRLLVVVGYVVLRAGRGLALQAARPPGETGGFVHGDDRSPWGPGGRIKGVLEVVGVFFVYYLWLRSLGFAWLP